MEDFCQKRLVILGSTGSIGTQALQVADQIHAQVVGLAAWPPGRLGGRTDSPVSARCSCHV